MIQHSPSPHKTPGAGEPDTSRRRWFAVPLLALAAGFTGGFTTRAVSHDGPFGFGRGWHRGGFMDDAMDATAIKERVDRAVQHLAVEIDATSQQQEELRAIFRKALGDLLPLRDTARAARHEARDLLTRPTIDREAIERFRSKQMALWDTASRRFAEGLTAAAEVLTPEQRRSLAKRLPADGGFWHGRHRG